MTVPLSRIASAPAETMILLDMTPRLDMHGIQPAGVECVVIPAKASQVHDALRGIEGKKRVGQPLPTAAGATLQYD
jgi:hypothetical protein